MTILDVQKALSAAGFDPGPLDGVMGPRTRAAIIAYQRAKGLEPDGIVGPITRAALLGVANGPAQPAQSIPLDMPWLIEAARLRGLREEPGSANNPIIMNWAHALGAPFSGDEVPWCGLFVAHCVASTLPDDPLPTNILGARQWLKFGRQARPQLGAILVFWRGSPTDWKGHVGLYWAQDDTHHHVLGGNQSNAVSITRIARNRLLDARWPATQAVQNIARVASPAGVLVSVNEA